MTNQWQGGQTRVNHLRVRGRGLDPVLTQLRLANLLGGARLSPPGLSPSAILCVRRLQDPLPGALPLRRSTGSVTAPRAWERAVESALEQMARSAARPVRETAPASADAVLFADRAEMLACLAADRCDSVAASRWWWQSLFRGTDAASALMPALLEAPAYIPATLEHLSRAGKAEMFVRSLGETDTRSLLKSLTHSFSLPQLESVLERGFDGAGPTLDHASAELAHESFTQERLEAVQASANITAPPQSAPWRQHVPESESPLLRPLQQALLGIGLLLLRAPSLVRSRGFARDTQSWLKQSAVCEEEGASHSAQTINAQKDATREGVSVMASRSEIQEAFFVEAAPEASGPFHTEVDMDEGDAPPSPVNVEAQRLKTKMRAGRAKIEETADAHPSTMMETKDCAGESSLISEPSSLDMKGQRVELDESGPMPETGRTIEAAALAFEPVGPSAARAYDTYIETELGGIFYLVNIAIFLELYGDFTMPAEPGLSLGMWDFLTLFGAELLGEKFYQDPLSALLMRMAGRDQGEAPGHEFKPPEDWRLPCQWLASFPERAACEWAVDGGRLRVRHPEGFILLDVSLKADEPGALLLHEMEAYKGCADFELRWDSSQALSQVAREADALKRWLGWLAPYVRARLGRAFGLAVDDAPAQFLFEHEARVRVSATHLDVFFSIAALPVEIRLAGIDRDPGWVPSAGRYIAFHYE
jgi:hypothetical protein